MRRSEWKLRKPNGIAEWGGDIGVIPYDEGKCDELCEVIPYFLALDAETDLSSTPEDGNGKYGENKPVYNKLDLPKYRIGLEVDPKVYRFDVFLSEDEKLIYPDNMFVDKERLKTLRGKYYELKIPFHNMMREMYCKDEQKKNVDEKLREYDLLYTK